MGNDWDFTAFRKYVVGHARQSGIAAGQADLARATGLSETLLSKWFRGKTQPTVASLRRIAATIAGTDVQVMMVMTGHLQGEAAANIEVAVPRQSHPLVYELDDVLADESLPDKDRDEVASLVDRILAPYRSGRRRTA